MCKKTDRGVVFYEIFQRSGFQRLCLRTLHSCFRLLSTRGDDLCLHDKGKNNLVVYVTSSPVCHKEVLCLG